MGSRSCQRCSQPLAQFSTTGIIGPEVLVEASVTYLAHSADAGADVVVLDSLIPYVPSLLAFGYDEDAINALVPG